MTEAFITSAAFDASNLFHALGAAGESVAGYAVGAVHFFIAFVGLFFTFVYLDRRDLIVALPKSAGTTQNWKSLLHLATVSVFWLTCRALTGRFYSKLLLVLWLLAGVTALLSAALAFLPLSSWTSLFWNRKRLSGYAFAGALIAAGAVAQSWKLWPFFSRITFSLVAVLLKPFLTSLFTNADHLIIGSARFRVVVASSCSGLEGQGLLLIFLAVWFVLFRKEIRFPQALLLIPSGMALLFFLNAVRIGILVLIGNAGFPEVATRGFHSQAGWIAFNFVALLIPINARKLSWISRNAADPGGECETDSGPDPVSVYLIPFLAVLAAGMLARAVSAGFEWLYPLRLVAVIIPLILWRKHYSIILKSRLSGSGVLAGILVFVIWVALESAFHSNVLVKRIPSELTSVSPLVRVGWISLRIITTVVAIPIAEELAFRGYLMRRVVQENFALVSPNVIGPVAILISSLAFGLLHDNRWLAGTIAGLLYALLYKKSESLGNVVFAHSLTNLLLAATTLIQDDWRYW